jgi:hypothetical protein
MASRQIRSDIYPSAFTYTDADGNTKTIEKVRTVTTLDHVYVFQDGNPHPHIIFEDRLTSYTPPVPATRVKKAAQLLDRKVTLETEEGFSAEIVKMSGCGCGSRLKTMTLDRLFGDGVVQAASTNDQ